MARIFTHPECTYVPEGQHFRADGTVRKKVTGTAMGGILGVSPFTTPFQIACNLLGLCSEDIGNKPAVIFGKEHEEEIIDYIGKAYPEYGAFTPAKVLFAEREGDHDKWESDFDDDMFAGHVDGMVLGPDGEDHILEIKTSANIQSWEDGVPEYYQLQVMLYNRFLSRKDKAYVALGLRDETTGWEPNGENVFLFEMPIDQEAFEDTLDKVRVWYHTYIMEGITPDYDPAVPGDVEMYNHLMSLLSDAESVQDMIDQYYDLDMQEKEHDLVIKEVRDRKEGLKTRIKDWFDCHDVEELDSRSGGCYAKMSVTERTSIDPELMRADGLDPDKYTVIKQVKTFTVKRRK